MAVADLVADVAEEVVVLSVETWWVDTATIIGSIWSGKQSQYTIDELDQYRVGRGERGRDESGQGRADMNAYGADFLQLDPAAAPAKGLTTWLVDQLRSAIVDGRLPTATTMPPSRVLAADLGVSRGVVVEAYQRLADEGLIDARRGAGTTVLPLGETSRPTTSSRSEEARWTPPGTLSPLLPLTDGRLPASVEIDLSPGVPDLSAFPRAAWLRAERSVLNHSDVTDLGYGDPRGNPLLRRRLAGWLARKRGVRADADDIVVVNGVAQALALLTQTLRRRGTSAVGVEDPGSRGARDEVAYWGMQTVPVGVDEDGMRVDELAGLDVPAVVLTPAHQFPTGVVLAPQRRRALLEWAAERGGLIVEDDYDAEYRYDRAPVPALQASAPEYVAHVGSASKTLAPGLRIGWLLAPRELQADLVAAKHASDLGSPALAQLVLADLIAGGQLDAHIRSVRTRQRKRRDALLGVLRHGLPRAHIQGVAAGLHLLITFPDLPVTDTVLAERILEAGVLAHPVSWHRMTTGVPGLVLGYAAHSVDRLCVAAARVVDVVARSSPS